MKIVAYTLLTLAAAGSATGGTITVTHGNVVADGTTCTLAQAIDAANRANNPGGLYGSTPDGSSTVDPLRHSATREIGSGSCSGATGSFADPQPNSIVFAAALAGSTLEFAVADNFWYGPNALPPIASDIRIDGGEAGITLRNTNTTRLRFFFVGADATAPRSASYNTPGAGGLTLRRLHLVDGRALGGNGSGRGGGGAGLGGAIYNQGVLHIEMSTLSGNRATGGNGGSSAGDGGGVGGGLGGAGMGGTLPLGVGNAGSDASGPSGGTAGTGGGRGGNGDSQSGGATTRGAAGGGGGFGGGPGGLGSTGTAGSDGPAGGAFGSSGGAASTNSYTGGGGGGVGAGGGGGSGSTVFTMVNNGGGGGGGGFGGGGGGGGAATNGFVGGNGGSGGFGGGGAGAGLRGGASSTIAGTAGFAGGNGSAGGQSSNVTPNGGGGGAGLGGAIFNHAGEVTLDQVTLSDNLALGGQRGLAAAGHGRGFGGAVFNLDGAVALNHVTAAGNAAEEGTAIYNRNLFATASLVVQRSLIADNTGSGDITAMNATITGSVVESAAGTTPSLSDGVNGNRVGVDPLLGVLADNDGPTPTRLPATGSVAIDLVACAVPPGDDQRGVTRPLGAQCDAGAVEFVPPGTLAVSVDGSGSVSAGATPVPTAGGIAACEAASGTCQATYAVGAMVTLVATPAVGHRLASWGDDCAAAGSSAQAQVEAAASLRVCSVRFERNPPGVVAFGTLPALDRAEGNAGPTPLAVPLILDNLSAEAVTLTYTLTPAAGSDGVVASDFSTPASGSVDIPAGQPATTLTLQIVADTMVEPDESFQLSFGVASTLPPGNTLPNASLSPAVAGGLNITLRNDDSAVLSAPQVAQAEAAGTMHFDLALGAPVQGGIAVGYLTVADNATPGTDYVETQGVLLHNGTTTQPYRVSVPVIDDTRHENDERFALQLIVNCAYAPCAVSTVHGTGTIQNDDNPGAGLSILIDNGRRRSVPGDALTYRILLSNGSSVAANGVTVTASLPATLAAAAWACSAPAGGVCNPVSGAGAVAATVDLPAMSQALIEVDATVVAVAGQSQVAVSTQLGVPAGYVDTTTSDNVATDTDSLADDPALVFRNGFEGD